jgi:Domain of unknown function (DUF1707)
MTGPRTPHTIQVWAWPMAMRPDLDRPRIDAVPLRIGDAERDRAVSDLGDHFAAGRLTREEFDNRVDQAMAARFDRDLQPLFVDLPRNEPVPSRPAGPPLSLRVGLPLLLWWLPLLFVVSAVVVTVLLGAPWLIWIFCWVLFMGAFWGRGRRHHRHYSHRYR